MTDKEIFNILKKAMHLVRINIPYLSELLDHVDLVSSRHIETAGITATGKLVYNPDWISSLSLDDIMFIIAHEIMHLALRSHDRSEREDSLLFNIAHDFIINYQLKELLNFSHVPANGLDWEFEYQDHYPLEDKPAEELIVFIRDAYNNDQFKQDIFRQPWSSDPKDAPKVFRDLDYKNPANKNRPFAEKLRELLPDQPSQPKPQTRINNDGILEIHTDVLSAEIEKILFPNQTHDDFDIRKKQTSQKIGEALSLKVVMEKSHRFTEMTWGDTAGSFSQNYEALRSFHKPPWEMALQNWMEHIERTGRTYSRPSRRGQFADFVRPGFKREGQTLHIVLDTSGSMDDILGKILGIIASFCEALMIPSVHIIQCDTEISDDSWYSPSELLHFTVKGLGGSDMSAGMQQLAEDDQVEHALVITDGWIDYPKDPMPYEVLWVIDNNEHFNPPYGKVIRVE